MVVRTPNNREPNLLLQAARERRGLKVAGAARALEEWAYVNGHTSFTCSEDKYRTWEKGCIPHGYAWPVLTGYFGMTAQQLGLIAGESTPVSALAAADTVSLLRETACMGADREVIDQVGQAAERLAVEYLRSPPAPMFQKAQGLRAHVLNLRRSPQRPGDASDLCLVAGRLSGVLAYAALDNGDAPAAHEHARAAYACGEVAGDGELCAWARGTQSLIARFAGDYQRALKLARDGMRHGSHRASRARLLCGQAQSLANLGDAAGALAALAAADHAREQASSAEDGVGLFAFSTTKQTYYVSSCLVWLDGADNARRAEQAATQAIAAFQAGPADERSLDDEYLAHVYLATARVNAGEIDGVLPALAPVLELPADERISWIRRRLRRVDELLAAGWRDASTVCHIRDAIAAF